MGEARSSNPGWRAAGGRRHGGGPTAKGHDECLCVRTAALGRVPRKSRGDEGSGGGGKEAVNVSAPPRRAKRLRPSHPSPPNTRGSAHCTPGRRGPSSGEATMQWAGSRWRRRTCAPGALLGRSGRAAPTSAKGAESTPDHARKRDSPEADPVFASGFAGESNHPPRPKRRPPMAHTRAPRPARKETRPRSANREPGAGAAAPDRRTDPPSASRRQSGHRHGEAELRKHDRQRSMRRCWRPPSHASVEGARLGLCVTTPLSAQGRARGGEREGGGGRADGIQSKAEGYGGTNPCHPETVHRTTATNVAVGQASLPVDAPFRRRIERHGARVKGAAKWRATWGTLKANGGGPRRASSDSCGAKAPLGGKTEPTSQQTHARIIPSQRKTLQICPRSVNQGA